MSEASSLLSIKHLEARYGDFQALFGIDMQIFSGEVIAIIGANGAGKSTLLRSIAGLHTNASEQIVFKNKAIGSLRADKVARAGISLVPEGRQLFPSLTVEENLKLGGRVKRPGKWSLATVYELFPVLHERRDVPSSSLSGGQQQMVAISRALMSNPELILFDEISLGLAPVIVDTVYKAMPQIIDGGVTAILVEQDISRALSIASRVYCLQEGRVQLEGDPATLSRDEITRAYFGVAA